MNFNPAYVQAVQDSLQASPYPHLIGLKIASLDFDACRMFLAAG